MMAERARLIYFRAARADAIRIKAECDALLALLRGQRLPPKDQIRLDGLIRDVRYLR